MNLKAVFACALVAAIAPLPFMKTSRADEMNAQREARWKSRLEFEKKMREKRWSYEDKRTEEQRSFEDQMKKKRRDWELKREGEMEKSPNPKAGFEALRAEGDEFRKKMEKDREEHKKKMESEDSAFREEMQKERKDFMESQRAKGH